MVFIDPGQPWSNFDIPLGIDSSYCLPWQKTVPRCQGWSENQLSVSNVGNGRPRGTEMLIIMSLSFPSCVFWYESTIAEVRRVGICQFVYLNHVIVIPIG
jgi:hypothetical protein